jgi:hypothetical protein
MRTVNIVFELTSFFFWNSLLNELSKPCTLSLTNMHKNTEKRENKEVARWMSHSKHRTTYSNLVSAKVNITLIQLYHPIDGITNPKNKLLHFLTTIFFKEMNIILTILTPI